jgi:hypothetical protein
VVNSNNLESLVSGKPRITRDDRQILRERLSYQYSIKRIPVMLIGWEVRVEQQAQSEPAS